MILRAVINAEQRVPYNAWDLDLDCGHRLEWVRVGRRFPKKKRCEACEVLQAFAERRSEDYSKLLRMSCKVPLDDRPRALFEWVCQIARHFDLQSRIPDLDSRIALDLAQMPGTYPLSLDPDDWENPIWESCP
jgi:hypothetical protein